MKIDLPYPPSVNHYWRRVGARTLISRQGRLFRDEVAVRLRLERVQAVTGRLSVQVWLHPPDRRRRDLDNVLKALLDAIQHGGGYEDDSQIDRLSIERCECVPDGKVTVAIEAVRLAVLADCNRNSPDAP